MDNVTAKLAEALKLLLSYTRSCEALLNCSPAGQIAIADAALAAYEQAQAEPVGEFVGRRLSPEGTREFWGVLYRRDGAHDPAPGTKLFAAPVAQAEPIPTQQTEPPHLFEFWWERYMPEATQSQAWEAWQAAPRADGVGVAAQGVPAALPVPLSGPQDHDFASGYGEGYAEGWNQCRDSMLATLAATPAQAKQAAPRKPLTDEQIAHCIFEARMESGTFKRDGTMSYRIARAIEAAHGIGASTGGKP